jgi:PRTRC genetic system protein B
MSQASLHPRTPDSFELDSGIMLYRSSNQGSVYATYHPARNIDGRPTLLAGVPATAEQLAEIAKAADQQAAFRGFVPSNVLYIAPRMLAWWTPACGRHIWFTGENNIGNQSGLVNHPPLLFIARNDDLFVFALRENQRPDTAATLYHAPYFNVWESGHMCSGNVDVPTNPGPQTLAAYEDAFFLSKFTHANHKNLIKRKGGATRLWLDLLGGVEFPLQCLVKTKLTVEQTIKKISSGV